MHRSRSVLALQIFNPKENVGQERTRIFIDKITVVRPNFTGSYDPGTVTLADLTFRIHSP